MVKNKEVLRKIAVVLDDTSIFEGSEGEAGVFEFTVENQSEIAWPFKPYL